MKILQHWKLGDADLIDWLASEGLIAREIPRDSLLVIVEDDGTAHAVYREYDIHHIVGIDGREHALRRSGNDGSEMKSAWRLKTLASAPPEHCHAGPWSLALERAVEIEATA